MTWRTGLCSVTFRRLPADEVIGLAAGAGLDAVEWGTDVHLPPGDTALASALSARCRDAGLTCPTLGSYARATGSDRSQPFAPILDTAEALGARCIRVWAGETGFHAATVPERNAIAASVCDYAASARARGMTVGLEYHPDTLTDCREGALWLLQASADPALFSYWQPVPDQPVPEAGGDLAALGDRLAHIHVFHWKGAEKRRRSLAEAVEYWAECLSGIPAPPDGHAFLEFLPEDDPDRLNAEATALRTILRAADGGDR